MRCRPCAAWRRAAIATRIDRRPAWSMWRWRGAGGGGAPPPPGRFPHPARPGHPGPPPAPGLLPPPADTGASRAPAGAGALRAPADAGALRAPAGAGALQAPADAGAWLLTGPGIPPHATLPPCGLAHDFVPQWQANHAAFPCGVDLLLGGAAHIVGLPRTTRIVRTPHDTTEEV